MAQVQSGPDGARWLAEDTARARKAGAAEALVLAVSLGAPGDRLLSTLRLAKASCVLLLARGAPSVSDIDLFAYADDGTTLGADEAPDKDAGLLVCPPHPNTIYVVGRIAAGHGIVAVSAQEVPPGQAPKVGAAMNARGRVGEQAVTEEAWPELEDKLAARRRALGGNWQTSRRVGVPLDPRSPSHLSAAIEANKCIDVLIVPSDEVSHIDATVLDTRGRVVGRAQPIGRDRGLVVCSPTQVTITVELRPHAGRGLAAVLVSRSDDAERSDLPLDVVRHDVAPLSPLKDALDVLDARLEPQPYGPKATAAKGTTQVGRRGSYPLRIPRGCTRVDTVLGSPARGLSAWLYDERRQMIAHSEGTASSTMFACGTGTTARLDIEAQVRGGPFAVELRPARRSSPVLTHHPLAAGRLLARLADAGLASSPEVVGDPRVLELTPTKLVTEEALVPVGRCVSFTVALGAGASGSELRLVDTNEERELELVVGTYSATARACALDSRSSLKIRAEMRVSTGNCQALFSSRMITPE